MRFIHPIEGEVRNICSDPARFQQLTPEDELVYGVPRLVLLDPPLSECVLSNIKRQNWLDWRAAPYPDDRHSEYLLRPNDLMVRHPRILLSAVLNVTTGLEKFLSQFSKKQRYQISGRKAANAGFTARVIRPAEHSAEIWTIIHSSLQRQGRGIATGFDIRPKDHEFAEYLNFEDSKYQDICVGGFTPDGQMVSYILGKRVGDHVQYDEIMTHKDYLKTHVMSFVHYFFLVKILEQEVIPQCLNYGPWYSGANAFSTAGGLNSWKRKNGFQPAYLISVF